MGLRGTPVCIGLVIRDISHRALRQTRGCMDKCLVYATSARIAAADVMKALEVEETAASTHRKRQKVEGP